MSAYAQPLSLRAEAEAARRSGDIGRALGLSTTAVSAFFDHRLVAGGELKWPAVFEASTSLEPARATDAYPYFQQWGRLLEQAGVVQGLADELPRFAARLSEPGLAARLLPVHVGTVFALLGFDKTCSRAWSDIVFERFALPWLLDAAARGDFANALAIETVVYSEYVLREESSAWFKASTARWVPALAAAARAHRPATPHSRWRPEATRRVALFLHNATTLAHATLMSDALAAAARAGLRGYEFTVFVFAGRDARLHQMLTASGARVRYLHEGLPPYEFAPRLARLERELAAENFAMVLWVTQVPMMALAFPRRVAPVQGWWSMKYHACEIEEIDLRLGVENVVLEKAMDGHEWRTFGSASDSWIDASLAGAARKLREGFGPDVLLAASIGRDEKLDSPAFLDAVCELLRAEPRMVFLWTGREQRASIQQAFERAGVAARTRFMGWVDTQLYAQAIDLFLDSFPFPAGFTLKQAMAAGKPVVMMRTAESLETGVPGAITPVIEGTAKAPPETRERLRATFTQEQDFDLYFCAANPAEYVAMARRLLADPDLRERAGAANRAFVEQFLSAPVDEGRKLLDHLDAVFATHPALAGVR